MSLKQMGKQKSVSIILMIVIGFLSLKLILDEK